MKQPVIVKYIIGPPAPSRLVGREVIFTLTEQRFVTKINMPDDPLPEELAYLNQCAQVIIENAGLPLEGLSEPYAE